MQIGIRYDIPLLIQKGDDSGIGISTEDLARIFQEVFRTDQAKASGEIGTGPGLAIVKQIVESYHGEVRVTSKLQQGSRFTFVLPLKPTCPESTSTPAKVPEHA